MDQHQKRLSRHVAVAEKDKVPLLKKIAFGFGGVASGIQDRFDNGVITPVFVIGVGFSPILMSFCGGLYRIYDAFSDLLVGWLSDNTRTRWGRRRPYVFGGAFLMALSMPWLFLFDPTWSLMTIGVWMIAFNLLIMTTQTIYEVPYQGLLIESTPDSNERTNVSAWRGYIGILVGIAVSWTWWLSQLPVFHVDGEPNVLNGVRWLVFIAAVPVVIFGVLPALFIQERFYKEAILQKKIPIRDSLRFAFSNRAFLLLAAFIFVYAGGTNLHWGLVFYVKLFHVCGGDQELASEIAGWQGTIQAFFGLIGVPIAQKLSLRIGKMKAIIIAMICFFLSSISTWFLMTPVHPYLSIIPFVMLGPVTTIIWVIMPSMLGDVIDYDEYRNSYRMEGLFSAAFNWFLKVSRTLASVLSGPIVVWAGYEASKRHQLAQNAEVLFNMRILLMTIPALFILAAAVILWFYPIDQKTVTRVRQELEARRGEI